MNKIEQEDNERVICSKALTCFISLCTHIKPHTRKSICREIYEGDDEVCGGATCIPVSLYHQTNIYKSEAWDEVFKLCDSLGMNYHQKKTGKQIVLHFIKELNDEIIKLKAMNIMKHKVETYPKIEYKLIEAESWNIQSHINEHLSAGWELNGNTFITQKDSTGRIVCYQPMFKRN